ncbi:Glycine-rich domain-containing protein 2 [Paramyrothecium foliicola]|nr:Glycine-rich domain-containing protein 2 [Paramyrothecium foliicola]
MSLENYWTTTTLHDCSKSSLSTLANQRTTRKSPLRTAQTPEEEPIIPPPSLFNFDDAQASDRARDVASLPHTSQCATHLQLLEVFHVLRQRILESEEIDAGFGIKPERVTKTNRYGETKTLKDPTLGDRRQIKWTVFIEFAAVRFLAWRDRLKQSPDTMLEKTAEGHLRLRNLPPLDVIMLWHSFMLNPRLLEEHCRDEPLYQLRMPWDLVHDSIRSKDWTFLPKKLDESHFESEVDLVPDLFEQFSQWDNSATPSAPRLTALRLVRPGVSSKGEDDALEFATSPASNSTNSAVLKYKKIFENVNPDLAVELADAVVRQTAFIYKMNSYLWIRSPALEGTIRRATKRYRNFLTLLKIYPGHIIVPTLDIDLVWHTHQCMSEGYAKAMKAIVGRFINHDDKIGKTSLATNYDACTAFYRVHFGVEYQICGCWDCEALLSAVEQAVGANEKDLDMSVIAQRALDEVTYYREVEIAVRNEEPLPLRN